MAQEILEEPLHDQIETDLLLMQLEAAQLEAIGTTFSPPEATLSTLPVTAMTIDQLERELELLKVVHDIFKGKGPDDAPNSMQKVVDMYAARMHDIETEIFERKVLV